MKKERPIIFNTEMVKAILEGRKTQTRRIVKLIDFRKSDTKGYDWAFRNKRLLWNEVKTERLINKYCPHGKVGDILYVRETWCEFNRMPYYKSDKRYKEEDDYNWKWKPSIHMPKEYSRIKLEITGIRIERVQDISEIDAMKEGTNGPTPYYSYGEIFEVGPPTFKDGFKELWNSINEKRGYGWQENPWVFVIDFKKIS